MRLDSSMRLRAPFVAGLLVLALGAPSVQAAPRSWYAYYLDARYKLIPAKKYREAIASLEQAVKLKPESDLEVQTYGLEFIDYLPYFYQGKCYLALGEYDSAIRFFNIEQTKKKIQLKDSLWTEMNKLRANALVQQTGAENEDKVKRLTQEITKLRTQATEQHKAGNLEDALSSLTRAQEMAKQLDRRSEAEIAELMKGIIAEKTRAEDEILASTTRENREALLQEGRRLFDAGRYEEAQRPLAEAASDKDATEAQDLLAKARKYVEGIQNAKAKRARVDQLLSEGEGLMGERRYADASVRFGSVLALEPDNTKAGERQRMALRLTGEEMFDKVFPNSPPVLNFLLPSGEGALIRTSTENQHIDVIGTAFDDRGLARIQFLQGGKVVAEQDLLASGDTPTRQQRVAHTFDLAKGDNDIKVVAIDTRGAEQAQAFLVTRNLLLIQKPWFLPSAVASSAAIIGLGFAIQRTRRRRAVRNRFNPYIAGAPVLEDDMFFG